MDTLTDTRIGPQRGKRSDGTFYVGRCVESRGKVYLILRMSTGETLRGINWRKVDALPVTPLTKRLEAEWARLEASGELDEDVTRTGQQFGV